MQSKVIFLLSDRERYKEHMKLVQKVKKSKYYHQIHESDNDREQKNLKEKRRTIQEKEK